MSIEYEKSALPINSFFVKEFAINGKIMIGYSGHDRTKKPQLAALEFFPEPIAEKAPVDLKSYGFRASVLLDRIEGVCVHKNESDGYVLRLTLKSGNVIDSKSCDSKEYLERKRQEMIKDFGWDTKE